MQPRDTRRPQLVLRSAVLERRVERTEIKRNPFHPFSSFDTATLAGVAFGQTVLGARSRRAVSSGTTTARTRRSTTPRRHGKLFCTIVNRFRPVYER
jgi:ribonuclease T